MKKPSIRWIFAAALAIGTELAAAVTLPAIFSDHAVLPQRPDVPVFGFAAPGETVTVRFNGQEKTVSADQDGRWRVTLNLADSTAGPFELRVNQRVVRDVAVGGVFLAAGEDGMNVRMKTVPGFASIRALPRDPGIRFFEVVSPPSWRPRGSEFLRGRWVVAAPDTVGNFPAIGYFFARTLRRKHSVPVGIVLACANGSSIENWMTREALRDFSSAMRVGRDLQEKHSEYPEKFRRFDAKLSAWEKRFGRDLPPVSPPGKNTTWTRLSGTTFAGDGIVWLRGEFDLPPAAAKRGFSLDLKRNFVPADFILDDKWMVNTRQPALQHQESFSARIPGRKLDAGRHTLLIRVHASLNETVRLPEKIVIAGRTVTGPWSIWREKDFGSLSPAARKSRPRSPGTRIPPEKLWHLLCFGKILPLADFAFTGILWYQGKSNLDRPWEYGRVFPAMIADWRNLFHAPELPFFFCLMRPDERPENAELRFSQLRASTLPHTGMVALSDLGKDRSKEERIIGERFAALALARIYKVNVPCEGPVAEFAKSLRGTVTVHFRNADGLAAMPPHRPIAAGFALADADGKWHPADRAEIADNTVILSSKAVPAPVKVRGGWNPAAGCLVNRAGLPVTPFLFFLRERK